VSIEAKRYVNKQGIEVIQNRMPGPQAHTPVVDTGLGTSARSDSTQDSMRIPPAVQAQRDDMRVRVLNEELNKESDALASSQKGLHEESAHPSSQKALDGLHRDIEAHETNMREISKELRAIGRR
jgi:hypothetical protein